MFVGLLGEPQGGIALHFLIGMKGAEVSSRIKAARND
jgi:hypothetical protein